MCMYRQIEQVIRLKKNISYNDCFLFFPWRKLFSSDWSSITVLEVIKPGNWPNPVSQLDRNPPPPSQCVKMGFIWTFLGKQNEQRKQSLNSFLLFTIANCMPICSTQWFRSTLMPKTSYIDLRNVCIKFIFNSQCPPHVQLQSFYWCLCHFPRHFFTVSMYLSHQSVVYFCAILKIRAICLHRNRVSANGVYWEISASNLIPHTVPPSWSISIDIFVNACALFPNFFLLFPHISLTGQLFTSALSSKSNQWKLSTLALEKTP